MTVNATLNVTGMNCAGCVTHVTRGALAVPGVAEVVVNPAAGRTNVAFDAGRTNALAVAAAITDAENAVTPAQTKLADPAVPRDANKGGQARSKSDAANLKALEAEDYVGNLIHRPPVQDRHRFSLHTG